MPRSIGWYLPHLASWRRYRVLSPTELAEKSGLSLSVLSRLEHQKGRAGAKTIDRLCEVLGVTREELLNQDPNEGKRVPAAA